VRSGAVGGVSSGEAATDVDGERFSPGVLRFRGSWATPAYEPRTANGQSANTSRGLAQTGLAATSDVEFSVTNLKSC